MHVKFLTLAVFLGIFSLFSCKMQKQACVENPKNNCICIVEYDPVCGCNQKTYASACVAECAGIKQYTKGECPPKSRQQQP
jgi:hypothetical protein